MENRSGHIHSVETFGALDGPGIRYVVFLQGCLLRCAYCHNPDTWVPNIGKEITANALVQDIVRYKNFILTGGVTLSGGEPFLQPEFCCEVLRLCKENQLHTAVDTCGAVPLSACKPAVDLADMLLLDIKAIDDELCKQITGQSNQNAIELLNYCELTKKRVWIRHVMVPGFTLERTQLEKLADFLTAYSCVERVELLPFHKMGAFKWENLGIDFTLKDTPTPTQEQIRMAKEIFESRNITV
jgi:pyruvate formate lyase activating enzyme